MRDKRAYDMRRRSASAAGTRIRILEAALRLFLEHLYDDVTFSKIAEAAGVSVPTVVLHFRTKDQLIEALVAWWTPQEEASREVASGDPFEAARVVCARYEETGTAVMRWLAIEERSPALRAALESGRQSHRRWVERTFSARLGRGASRERRVMALVAAYDLYAWHVLRRVLSAEDTVLAMAALARGIVDPKGAQL